MRKKIIVGNWKMNKGIQECTDFLNIFSDFAKSLDKNKILVGIAPSYLCLPAATKFNEDLIIAAQECCDVPFGAYTGMVSAQMLSNENIKWCLVGHSERRTYVAETNQKCQQKIKELLKLGMNVIYCIGETLEEFEKGISKDIIYEQISQGLADIDDITNVVIAYEPVWSIGTGKSASKEIAEEMCKYIRSIISKLFNNDVAEKIMIQYGGSVKPTNVREYMSQPDIDGVLVGGASLDCSSFIDLINKSI